MEKFHCLADELLRRASTYQVSELQALFILKARERKREEAARATAARHLGQRR